MAEAEGPRDSVQRERAAEPFTHAPVRSCGVGKRGRGGRQKAGRRQLVKQHAPRRHWFPDLCQEYSVIWCQANTGRFSCLGDAPCRPSRREHRTIPQCLYTAPPPRERRRRGNSRRGRSLQNGEIIRRTQIRKPSYHAQHQSAARRGPSTRRTRHVKADNGHAEKIRGASAIKKVIEFSPMTALNGR